MIYLVLFVLTMIGLLDNHPKRQLFWVVVNFVFLIALVELGVRIFLPRVGWR